MFQHPVVFEVTHVCHVDRSGELDLGSVIKTKKNTVALRTAKNKHEWRFIMLQDLYEH
jgi:hypothetical protein